MKHNLTLPAALYETVSGFIVTKHNPLYANGDTLTITCEGQRSQKEFVIQSISTEHIFKDWCVLGLKDATVSAPFRMPNYNETTELMNKALHDSFIKAAPEFKGGELGHSVKMEFVNDTPTPPVPETEDVTVK